MSNKEKTKNWRVAKLEDVVFIFDNLRKPINARVRQKLTEGKDKSMLFPYYGATGQVGWIDNYLTDGEYVLIGEDGAPFLDLFKDKAYIIHGKTWVNNHAHVLKGKAEISNKYLLYYLNNLDYRNYVNGTTRLKLTKGSLANIPLIFPPLPEQQFIVSKIDELFSELNKGVEELKAAQQQLKVYRQAVLKWAFEGKLTNEGVKSELPEGWKLIKLGKVCTKIQDGSHFSPQQQYSEPGKDRFMYITAKNIRNNYMDLSKITFVDKQYHDSIYSRCNPEFGDVLLTKDGVNTGEVTLNTFHEPFSLLSSVCIFKTDQHSLVAAFLKYFIQSPLGSKVITNSMTGTAIKRIILRKIKDAVIVLPTLQEQHQIVQEIESRLSVCDKIEETIGNGLKQAEALRQSILKQALEGKLLKEKKPSTYKPKNIYFYQSQTLAYISFFSRKKEIEHGEMTIAKYAYLLDKVYHIPTFYNFSRWHLGPYPPEMKKALYNKDFFHFNNSKIEVADTEKLFKYNNPYKEQIESAIDDLASIFSGLSKKERSHKTELLATVCKVVEDIQSLELPTIRQSMKEWPIDLPNTTFKNKAEKFTEEETAECLRGLSEKGWDKQLVQVAAPN